MKKVSSKLLGLLNEAVARELQVSIQYMWQHVLAKGVQGAVVGESLKKVAIVEMKHAEAIAERLDYFDEKPTTKPSPIFVGESLKEMLKRDVADEEGAITLYKQIIALARKEGDEVTENMFVGILADEEEHHNTFTNFLEGM